MKDIPQTPQLANDPGESTWGIGGRFSSLRMKKGDRRSMATVTVTSTQQIPRPCCHPPNRKRGKQEIIDSDGGPL